MQDINDSALRLLLKSKGIGPAGSKSFDKEKCEQAFTFLLDESLNVTTRLTLLTALLTLEKNEFEVVLITDLKKYYREKGHLFTRFLNNNSNSDFELLILKVIKREDLTVEEAKRAMSFFFDNEQPDFLKAAFLEAQRLKRETTTENLVFLKEFWARAKRKKIDQNILIDFCNSYDGWVRMPNYSMFTAMCFSEFGVSSLIHGIDAVAPKNGCTIKKVIAKSEVLQEKIASQTLNLFYEDQSDFFSELFSLKQMRHDMVKRPFLATIERLLQPVQAVGGNYQIIGYTHKAYKMEFSRIIQRMGQTKKAIILKGEEGSTQMSLSKTTEYALVVGDKVTEGKVSPSDFGIVIPDKPSFDVVDENYIIASTSPNHPGFEWFYKTVYYNLLALSQIFEIDVLIDETDVYNKLSTLS